jgi:hypothetical protein
MVLRLAEIILILAVLAGAAYYLINTYVIGPRRQAEQEIANTTTTAIEKAEVDYLEIRKAWINFSTQGTLEAFASSMDDMSIPEVAKFQKLMVVMNEKYDDLKDGTRPNEGFVAKTVALRTLFDNAVLAAKKKSLM